MRKFIFIGFLFLILLNSCNQKSQKETLAISEMTKNQEEITLQEDANTILQKAIEAHGGTSYKKAFYQFTFRNDVYTFKNNDGNYRYSVKKIKNGKETYDVLDNGSFKRTVDGVEKKISKGAVKKHSDALNSVLYFATLPHKLNDSSVKKIYKGTTTINGNKYNALEISFNQEHGDIFQFWINQENNIIDYFAYKFTAGTGGTRFRSAYNSRIIDGLRFQDYINYKAPSKAAFSDLPSLFEKGKLKKLSQIDTEEVINLNQ